MDIHFCGSPEASLVLADAGLGVAILPELLVPERSSRAKVKLKEAPGLSFGLFYKPYPGDAILKEFIQSAKRHLTDPTLTPKNKIV